MAESSFAPPVAPVNGAAQGRHGSYRVNPQVIASGGRAVLREIVGEPVPLVLKVFKEPLVDDGAVSRVGRLVIEGRRQFITDRKRLGSAPGAALNWPIDMVVEGTQVIGVVLPRVPMTYERANGSLRNMEFLLLHRGDPPTAAQRVTILIRLAELLDWLAVRQLVHGDIAPKNVLWTTNPGPEVLVLDVDGIHDPTIAASESVATSGWTDPRVIERIIASHDVQSDWYALGLFMYRGLMVTPGMLRKGPNGWPGPTLPPSFFPQLRAMLVRTLDDPLRGERPRPREWVTALMNEFFPNGTPNWAAFERLDSYVALRGTKDRVVSGRGPVERPLPATPAPRPWWRRI